MALANVAWILAANGNRVLIADWDLESPGLHRFFKPYLREDDLRGTGGVIDLIREYEDATISQSATARPDDWLEDFVRVRYPFTINWSFPGGGSLDFLSAGRQNDDYAVTVGALDWENFYNRLQGARFFDALRADMKRRWDYTLVDSRTGLSDVADICTLHLPDILVDCFTLSDQGMEGAARVARKTRNQRTRMKRQPRILPVPMRVDQAEKEKVEAGRALAVRFFKDLPADMTEPERRRYWSEVEVPYRAFYAYEETLAVFGDPPGSRTSLLAAYETLTSYITDGKHASLPVMDESLRIREKSRYERRYPDLPDDQIVLRYAAEDQVWAEWIERQLILADVHVQGSQAGSGKGEERRQGTTRTLTIISHSYLAANPSAMPPLEPVGSGAPLAVYVSDIRPLPEFPAEKSTTLVNQSASVAVDRILRLIGRQPAAAQAANGQSGPRFPGLEPRVFGAPARNARFTGREGELTRLREQLLSGGQAYVIQQRNQPTALPVALQGMGGIGKTQLAIEYVHRFRTAYDVVWWVQADPPEFVDSALADMAPQVGVAVEVTDTAADIARAVLQKLRSGEAGRRWLIVYDNAEAVDRVSPFIPPVPQDGSGHVMVTSRNVAWSESTNQIPIDVFRRTESIAHLRQRVERITEAEANSIAEVLGDLPIAVAVAGAWLAETGATPAEYLHEVERHGPLALSAQRTWDLSLDRLKQQSPAAYRLLQYCAVFAPEIALDLLTSDRMAEALAPIDPSVSERVMRGAPIQQMSRLALIKLDPHAGQVQMHRVLQAVVRDRMSDEELDAARRQVQVVLAGSRPSADVDDRRAWPRYRRLWPHLEASGAITSAEAEVRQLLIDRVRFLWLGGDLLQGERVARLTVEAWQEMLAADPEGSSSVARQLLHLQFNLGNILRALGRFTESRQLNEDVLQAQQALLGQEHPHTLMTAGSLAGDLRALGRYDEALPRDAETMQAWQKVLGEDHPRTMTAASNLAVSHRALGDFRAARALDEQVYERRRQVLGRDHQDTLLSASSLGRDMREAGEYERSVVFLQRVLQSYLEGYGPDDRGSLNAQANLAVSLRSAGRANEASQHLEDAYRRLNERFGPTSPDTLACRLSRSANFLVNGELEMGSVEMESVEEAYRKTLGDRHPHSVVCLNNLCVAARVAGDHERALEWAVRATAEFERALGDRHPYTLAATVNLAGCLMEVGQREAAHERMRLVADQMAQTLGPNHPDTLACLANTSLAKKILDGIEPDGTLPGPGLQLLETIGSDHPTVHELRQGTLSRRILDPHPY
ncbi:hypothetical protein GCM10027575_07620 [Phytohabitans suffuscus]